MALVPLHHEHHHLVSTVRPKFQQQLNGRLTGTNLGSGWRDFESFWLRAMKHQFGVVLLGVEFKLVSLQGLRSWQCQVVRFVH